MDKRYEEALERAKMILCNLPEWSSSARDIETIFPEMQESGDEKTRKFICGIIDNLEPKDFVGVKKIDVIRWLEKQKEQKSTKESEDERMTRIEILEFLSSPEISSILNEEKQAKFYSYIVKQKEQPKEELVYRLNGLMQDYIKEGKDEEEREHRFKCYKLFWDALEDSTFFEQKEQKPIISAEESLCISQGEYSNIVNECIYGEQKEQQPVPALDRGDEIVLKAICEELKDSPGFVERIEGWYRLARDAQQPSEWSEEDKKMLGKVVECITYVADRNLLDGDVSETRLKAWLLSHLTHGPHWRRAKEGSNLPESIILPDGEEPRFGKCAVKDSWYIPISELKELPKE